MDTAGLAEQYIPERPGDHRICFVGDSFVQGTCDPECRGWVGRVAAAARGRGYHVTAYNLGVRRDTSEDVLRRWQAECAARFQVDCSQYIVFSFGANDMTREGGRLRVEQDQSVANFTSIVSAARQACNILVIGPLLLPGPGQDERILKLCRRYQHTADELDVPYLPLASRLVGNRVWLDDVAAHDGLHPGSKGYTLVASHILNWPSWWFRAQEASTPSIPT